MLTFTLNRIDTKFTLVRFWEFIVDLEGSFFVASVCELISDTCIETSSWDISDTPALTFSSTQEIRDKLWNRNIHTFQLHMDSMQLIESKTGFG